MSVYLKLIVINVITSILVFSGGMYFYNNYINHEKIVTIDVKRLLDFKDESIKNPMIGVTLFNATKRYIEDKVGDDTIVLAKASVVNDTKFKDITEDVIAYSGISAYFDKGIIPKKDSHKNPVISEKELESIKKQANNNPLLSDKLLKQSRRVNSPDWLP